VNKILKGAIRLNDLYVKDVLVIGGGAAAARAAIEAARRGTDVLLVDKGLIGKSGSTSISIGGIAAPLGHIEEDSPDKMFEDIVKGGEYLNNQKLVRILVNEAADRVLELEKFGIMFDRQKDGRMLKLGQSGGHRVHRIAYEFYPDKIGKAIMRALKSEILRRGIPFMEEVFITSIITNNGRAVGATGLDIKTGEFLLFRAKSIVLATGGAGQLYGWGSVSARTTNPVHNTGDGFAIAYRAGAELMDMEMVQYMPMGFVYPKILMGVGIGEPGFESMVLKAKLFNVKGERFMKRYEPEKLEATTRDRLARAILTEIKEGRGTEYGGVYYDYTENPDYPKERPYRYRLFMDYCKVDPTKQWVQGAPTVHYFMGGIRINERCETNVKGLYAAGEVVGGIHGANRLGGNSLTDTQVFGARAGLFAAAYASENELQEVDADQVKREHERVCSIMENRDTIRPHVIRRKIQNLMWNNVGIFRDKERLSVAINELERIRKEDLTRMGVATKNKRYNCELLEALETENMLDVAEMITRASFLRDESRGAHSRMDYPHRNDEKWLKNIVISRINGEISFKTTPVVLTELTPEG
jgi:fumarate reductase (CoM/CoB) subunit A